MNNFGSILERTTLFGLEFRKELKNYFKVKVCVWRSKFGKKKSVLVYFAFFFLLTPLLLLPVFVCVLLERKKIRRSKLCGLSKKCAARAQKSDVDHRKLGNFQ